MKKIMLIFVAMCLSLSAFGQEVDTKTLWERGNHLYSASDWNGAVATYDSIVNAGWESAPLYYNLGSACFKAGKKGEAILNYYRAQRLAPADGDIAYNLAYAESFVKDKIEAVPEFILNRWKVSISRLMSANAWGVVSLLLLGVMLVAVAFYLLALRRGIRKTGFVVALVATVGLLLSLVFGGEARANLLRDNQAIVLSTAAAVKASPEKTGKDLFILHEGTKVEVLDTFGEWSEIRIADGNEGWIRSVSIEVI